MRSPTSPNAGQAAISAALALHNRILRRTAIRRVRKRDSAERVRAGLAYAERTASGWGRLETAARHAAEIRKLHQAGIRKSEIARRLHVGALQLRRNNAGAGKK